MEATGLESHKVLLPQRTVTSHWAMFVHHQATSFGQELHSSFNIPICQYVHSANAYVVT